jgi:hypothetical protein
MTVNLLQLLVIGALMGMLGQGARTVIGLKGMADDAKALNVNPQVLFDAVRLVVSLLIGILVGLASAVIYLKTGGGMTLDATTLLAWAAAGYAGTDALEGFISQYLSPGARPAAVKPQQPQVQVADYEAVTSAIANAIGCGSVKEGATPPKNITNAVLACIGVSSPTDPKTPMTKYFSQPDGSGDWLVPFVIKLESTSPFAGDALRMNVTDVAANGTTLGGFVACIQCCYGHPRPATS